MTHDDDVLSIDLMTITIMFHDPIDICHQIAPSFIERPVNLKLGFLDYKRSLLPTRLQREV
jgi:hypothetical protein